jgi:hypothetical protein
MGSARIARAALSGAFLANALPHTVRGVTGQPFPTPFADPPGVGLSSPATNVGWGLANLAIGALLRRRHARPGERVAFFVGAGLMLLGLSELFGANPRIAPKRRRR